MTIAAAIPIFRYDGNDSTTNFPFTQIFYEDDDLLVIRLELDGVTETTLVKDTDYTVNGVLTTSGSIDYPISGDPLATGEKLAILRATDKDRVTDLSDIFQFNTVNTDGDRAVAMIQETLETLSRCATFKVTNGDTPPTLEAIIAATAASSASHADFDNLTFATAGHVNFMENIHYLPFELFAPGTDCAEGTNLYGELEMPFGGIFLQSDTIRYLYARNSTAGVTGTMTIDIHLNGTTIMTTNKIDIETGEKSSWTAATQPDLTTTVFSAGDVVTIDMDSVHTTPSKGCVLIMAVRQT